MTPTLLAQAVVVVFGGLLIALAVVAFSQSPVTERFFMAFASSARTHYTEQIARLLVGASLVVASPRMWQGDVFALAGWAVVVSSAVLLLIPWRWHHRLGKLVLPRLVRHMRLYSVGMMAVGTLLLLGVFWGAPT